MSLIYGTPELASGEGSEIVPQFPFQEQLPDDTLGSNGKLEEVLLRAAGFGAGFAVIAAVIVVVVLWWSSRPPKPKPWDDKAITASYESLDTECDANTFRFVYTLQNNTDADYRIEPTPAFTWQRS